MLTLMTIAELGDHLIVEQLILLDDFTDLRLLTRRQVAVKGFGWTARRTGALFLAHNDN